VTATLDITVRSDVPPTQLSVAASVVPLIVTSAGETSTFTSAKVAFAK
tara:strand:- start:279 stop:422 length:144 start_codon:yes stop_codon:yes gene_type:complete